MAQPNKISKTPELRWGPEGLVCLHCGTPNPDRGNRCGNCGENPFSSPKLLTAEQMEIRKALARHKHQLVNHQ